MTEQNNERSLGKQMGKVCDRLTKIETILEERLGGYPDMVSLVSSLCAEFSGMKKDQENLQRRIEDVEETHTWLSRLVLGAVVLALVALVLVGKGGLP